jgi:hypothetical protein
MQFLSRMPSKKETDLAKGNFVNWAASPAGLSLFHDRGAKPKVERIRIADTR